MTNYYIVHLCILWAIIGAVFWGGVILDKRDPVGRWYWGGAKAWVVFAIAFACGPIVWFTWLVAFGLFLVRRFSSPRSQ